MRVKVLSYMSAGVGFIEVVFTISQWNIANLNSKLLSIFAIGSSFLLSIISLLYWNQKNRTLPQLIHLKGLCAVTHELHDLVTRIQTGTLKNEPTWSIIKSLIVSAHGRATALAAAGNSALESVRDELYECTDTNCSEDVIRRHVKAIFNKVDNADVKHLREAGVAHIVYPSMF